MAEESGRERDPARSTATDGPITSAAGVRREMTRLRLLLSEGGAVYGGRLPPLLLQHQLYANVADRTLVDRTVVRELRGLGCVRRQTLCVPSVVGV